MKYYISRTTKNGVMWKRTKCLDYWSTNKAECWQFSEQGAKQIVERYNKAIPENKKREVHYNYQAVRNSEKD